MSYWKWFHSPYWKPNLFFSWARIKDSIQFSQRVFSGSEWLCQPTVVYIYSIVDWGLGKWRRYKTAVPRRMSVFLISDIHGRWSKTDLWYYAIPRSNLIVFLPSKPFLTEVQLRWVRFSALQLVLAFPPPSFVHLCPLVPVLNVTLRLRKGAESECLIIPVRDSTRQLEHDALGRVVDLHRWFFFFPAVEKALLSSFPNSDWSNEKQTRKALSLCSEDLYFSMMIAYGMKPWLFLFSRTVLDPSTNAQTLPTLLLFSRRR